MRNNVNSSWLVGARKLLLGALAAGTFLVAHTLLVTPAFAKPSPKVEICHIPRGNPANAHTIRVSGNAVKAHLKHGDYVGPCGPSCECDDGNPCTEDICESGACLNSPVDCNDGNMCTADTCNTETGGCDNPPLPGFGCEGAASGCTLAAGTCDDLGSCVQQTIPNCCESDAECDDNELCTTDQCDGAECTHSEVDCTTGDLCVQGTCDPDTGDCIDVTLECEDVPCHSGYCDALSGTCMYDEIEGCCVVDADCFDGDNCTNDFCLGSVCDNPICHLPVSACLVQMGCTEQCDPVTEARDCDDGDACMDNVCDEDAGGCVDTVADCDDNDVCTSESCDSATGCVNTPVSCGDSDLCTVDICDPITGCTNTPVSCDTGEACNSETGNCEPPPPDLLVCGGGCFRHNSETGDEIDAFTLLDGGTGCGDPGRSQVLFNADGTFWLPRILNSSITRICIYDETADNLLYNYTLPNDFYTNGAFLIRNWTSTHLGKVYANPGGIQNVAPFIAWRVVTIGAFPLVRNTPDCGLLGTRPAEIVAAPQDPSDPQREYGYAVSHVNSNPPVTKLFEFEFAEDPLCTQVAIVGDDDPMTDNMDNDIGRSTRRLRIAPEGTPEAGAIYLLAAFGGVWPGTDEGIWRWRPGGALEQVIAMCDLLAQPCSSTPFEKPIVDFAIHPLNGNLYVLQRDVPFVASNPSRRTLEVYDPQGTSLGVIHEGTAVRHHIEFFPPN